MMGGADQHDHENSHNVLDCSVPIGGEHDVSVDLFNPTNIGCHTITDNVDENELTQKGAGKANTYGTKNASQKQAPYNAASSSQFYANQQAPYGQRDYPSGLQAPLTPSRQLNQHFLHQPQQQQYGYGGYLQPSYSRQSGVSTTNFINSNK